MYDRSGTTVHQGKMTFSINGARFIAYLVRYRKKGNLTSIYRHIQINSRWTANLNEKDKTIKFLAKTGQYLTDFGQRFLKQDTKRLLTKDDAVKLDTKLRTCVHRKHH